MAGLEPKDIHFGAIGLAMLANIVLGFAWYAAKSPTGRLWMRAQKIDPNAKFPTALIVQSMVLMVVGTFALMFFLAYWFAGLRDAYRLDLGTTRDLLPMEGLFGSLLVFVGFTLPTEFGRIGWEGRPWSLFVVNASYQLITFVIAGQIFAYFL